MRGWVVCPAGESSAARVAISARLACKAASSSALGPTAGANCCCFRQACRSAAWAASWRVRHRPQVRMLVVSPLGRVTGRCSSSSLSPASVFRNSWRAVVNTASASARGQPWCWACSWALYSSSTRLGISAARPWAARRMRPVCSVSQAAMWASSSLALLLSNTGRDASVSSSSPMSRNSSSARSAARWARK